jgi:glutathione S-transferase
VAGHRYRTAAGMIEVEAVDAVDPAEISDPDAHRAGFPSAGAVVAALRGDAADAVDRVRFHRVEGPDPRGELARDDALSPQDVAEIDRRLARLDRAASGGPWTAATPSSATKPLPAILDRLIHEPGVDDEEQRYLRNVQDHALRVQEQADAFRELLQNILSVDLTRETKALNEVSNA